MAQVENCIIEIDSQRLNSFGSFTIEQWVGQPDNFNLICWRNALIPENELETTSLSSLYSKVGKEITFQIENINTGDGNKNFFFKGIITEIVAGRDSNLRESVTIKGYSPEIFLQGYRTRRSFENKTLNQIVQEVLRPYPQDTLALSSDAQPRDTNVYPYIVQYDETNYDFLVRLGKNFSEWFYYDGRNLVFGTPRNTMIDLTHSVNLSAMQVGSSILPAKFHSKFHDPIQDRDIEADSESVNIDQYLTNQARSLLSTSRNRFPDSGYYNYYNSYSLQPDPINQVFESQKKRIAAHYYLVGGLTSEPLTIGNAFQLHGRGGQNSNDDDLGEFQVYFCKHSLTNDLTYSNEINALPKALQLGPTKSNPDIRPYPESAVVTDNNDPEQLGRVRVRTSWQDQGQMTPWTRVITPHSGDARGTYFVPEIGDEVLVDYEHGDPQKPVVIGTLYGKSHGPEQGWVTGNNDMKKIRTRSGHTIEFDDTSGSEKLVIYNGSGSSADSNSNKISLELSPEKITIESQGDLELKGKNIKLDAQEKLDLHAASGVTAKTDSGDVSISGTQVTIKADATLSEKGAMVEIEGSGTTTIKGSIVQIN